jgi:GPH family glycoside/pentoside/hexuronide:cation symporter
LPNKLSRRTKLLYGFGDIGFSMTSTIIGAFFSFFLINVVGISPGYASIPVWVGLVSDLINDPLIGHLSDRTRTRWGRRRPFLLFGFPPFALAFAMLWWRPPWESLLALLVYYAIAYVVFDVSATFVYMPYFALTPELTPNYDERTALTSYRMFFSIAGGLIAFTLPSLVVGEFRPESASNVLAMGLVFGFASALPLLATFFGTREREEYMEQAQPNLRQSLRSARGNRPFIFGLVIFLLTGVAMRVIENTLVFFIKDVLQQESRSWLYMGTIFVVAALVLPFWEWTSRRWSKRWAYAAGIAFWAAVQIVLITVNASTAVPLVLTLCVLAGIGVSAAHVLPWAIVPDAIEWDEWKTGERHEGMFYSLSLLAQKATSAIAIPLVLLLLEFTGYEPLTNQQPDSALLGLRIVMGPIPAVLLCVGILFALLYPLSREEHSRVVRELEERRARKTEAAI